MSFSCDHYGIIHTIDYFGGDSPAEQEKVQIMLSNFANAFLFPTKLSNDVSKIVEVFVAPPHFS